MLLELGLLATVITFLAACIGLAANILQFRTAREGASAKSEADISSNKPNAEGRASQRYYINAPLLWVSLIAVTICLGGALTLSIEAYMVLGTDRISQVGNAVEDARRDTRETQQGLTQLKADMEQTVRDFNERLNNEQAKLAESERNLSDAKLSLSNINEQFADLQTESKQKLDVVEKELAATDQQLKTVAAALDQERQRSALELNDIRTKDAAIIADLHEKLDQANQRSPVSVPPQKNAILSELDNHECGIGPYGGDRYTISPSGCPIFDNKYLVSASANKPLEDLNPLIRNIFVSPDDDSCTVYVKNTKTALRTQFYFRKGISAKLSIDKYEVSFIYTPEELHQGECTFVEGR